MIAIAAAFLYLAVLLLTPAPGQGTGPALTCCLKTKNTKIRVALIDRYYVQKKGLCPVDAVVFTTVEGRSICSKPSARWTLMAMATVDSRRRITPTTNTTSPNTPSEAPATVLLHNPASGQGNGQALTCCLKTKNTKIRVGRLDHYYVQKKGLCPVDAVVFITVRGRSICSKPSGRWTLKAMATVDRRRRITPTTNSTSPSEAPATVLNITTKTTK